VLPPGVLAVLLVTAVLALIPARRLYLAGQPTILIGAYFGVLWLLGALIAFGPGRSRLFVPLILVLYLVPFITWRAGLDRLLGRLRTSDRARGPRNVTPPAEHDRPSSRS
jgi:hypothetical protein